MFFQDLAAQLAPDMPVYSFNWPEPTMDSPPADTLPTIVEEFLQNMKTRVPHGPYIVGGFCFGAVIAIEMAKNLVASGEQVKLLVLIDPVMPSTDNHWQRRKRRLFSFIRYYRQRGIRFFMRLQYRKCIEMVQDLRSDTKEKWERQFQKAHTRAFRCYQGEPYPHRTLLGLSNAEQVESDTERSRHQDGRWKNIIPFYREILVLPDCSHDNILSHGAGKIAERIREIEGEIEKAV